MVGRYLHHLAVQMWVQPCSFHDYLLRIVSELASSLLQTLLACFLVPKAFTVKPRNSQPARGGWEAWNCKGHGCLQRGGVYGANGNFGIESRNSMSVTVQEKPNTMGQHHCYFTFYIFFFHCVRRGPNTPADSMPGLK